MYTDKHLRPDIVELASSTPQNTPFWSDVWLMMMAHDMSPTPPTLDDATLSTVRSALGAYVREGEAGGTLLRDALHRLSSEAQAKGISAEHLLIILKNLLSSLPELREVDKPGEREKLKQRIVTVCIEQYYRK